MVEEETNQEDWKNHTINPMEELDDEEIGNAVLISYIEEIKTKVWINAKENMAMELAIKENEKKTKLTNKELVLQLMNNKEVKPSVLMFGTEQVQLLRFDSQVIQVSSSSQCSCSKTLRVPIARCYDL